MQKHCSIVLSLATIIYALCNPVWAVDRVAGRPAVLEVRDGLVTVDTQGATIEQIARALSDKAGFEVRLSGNLDDPVHLSVKNMPLARFLRKLAGEHSLIVIDNPTDNVSGKKPDRPIAAVYIVANPNVRIASQEILREAPARAPEEGGQFLEARRVLEDSLGGKVWATPDQRVTAIESLASSTDKESIRTLERVVAGETDAAIRDDAVNALAKIGGQEATLALGRILFGNSSPQARLMAIRALATLEGDIPRSFITKALKDRSASVRREAANALAR